MQLAIDFDAQGCCEITNHNRYFLVCFVFPVTNHYSILPDKLLLDQDAFIHPFSFPHFYHFGDVGILLAKSQAAVLWEFHRGVEKEGVGRIQQRIRR